MQTSEVIEQSTDNVDESQIINALRNISELKMTKFRYSFEWERSRMDRSLWWLQFFQLGQQGERWSHQLIQEIQKEKQVWEMLERAEMFFNWWDTQDIQVRVCDRHVKTCLMGRTLSESKVWRTFFIINVNKLILTCTRNSGMKYINEVYYCKSQNNIY